MPPPHTYVLPGVYEVILSVTDERGAVDTDVIMITVTEPTNTPGGGEIPEFPTVALPVITVIGLMFLFQRRKGK